MDEVCGIGSSFEFEFCARIKNIVINNNGECICYTCKENILYEYNRKYIILETKIEFNINHFFNRENICVFYGINVAINLAMIIERYANMSDNNFPVYPVESIGTHTQPVITKLVIQN